MQIRQKILVRDLYHPSSVIISSNMEATEKRGEVPKSQLVKLSSGRYLSAAIKVKARSKMPNNSFTVNRTDCRKCREC